MVLDENCTDCPLGLTASILRSYLCNSASLERFFTDGGLGVVDKGTVGMLSVTLGLARSETTHLSTAPPGRQNGLCLIQSYESTCTRSGYDWLIRQ